jgi:RNA polymerase sigma-70 factor (ECF subfamily)
MKDLIKFFAFKFHLDPDDLHQDIQLKLLQKQNLYSIQEGASYKTWLSYMIRNHCIDQTRKIENKVKLVDIEHVHRSVSYHKFDNRQELARIFFFIRRTFPNKRRLYTRILWLLMIGEKYEDIATELNMPLGTVKAVIHKLRKTIRN